MLMNAFHPGLAAGREHIVKNLGGLHKFTWVESADSDVTRAGIRFFLCRDYERSLKKERSSRSAPSMATVRTFTPESVVDIELALAPDMAMVLDECPPYPCTPQELTGAVDRSIRWAERSVKRIAEVGHPDVNFFGIIQGGFSEHDRQRSLDATAALPFPGLALGGFCVGETIEDTHSGIMYTASKMPADRPRYLMGMGTPIDLLLGAAHGIDLFDCTLPTRNGRNGLAFTSVGKVRIKNAEHTQSDLPLDPNCNCYACKNFSRAFLRHLLLARDMNAAILTSLHNSGVLPESDERDSERHPGTAIGGVHDGVYGAVEFRGRRSGRGVIFDRRVGFKIDAHCPHPGLEKYLARPSPRGRGEGFPSPSGRGPTW